MLMEFDMMCRSKPTGENRFRFYLKDADEDILKKAIAFDEFYSFAYGHQIFDNLEEIKEALKQKQKNNN